MGGKSTHLKVHLLYKLLQRNVQSKHTHTNQDQWLDVRYSWKNVLMKKETFDLECKDCNVGMVFVQSFSAYLNSCKDGTWIREKVKHFCFFFSIKGVGDGVTPKLLRKKLRKKTVIFGPKTLFSALFSIFFLGQFGAC